MVCVHKERGACTVPTENLDQAAVRTLSQAAPADGMRQASTEDTQATEPFDHVTRYVRLAVNHHRVDLLAAKPAQLVSHAVGNRFAVGHDRPQFGIQKSTEEEALDEAR